MRSDPCTHGLEREQELLARYGLEHDARADHAHELELADRLAGQASLPSGSAARGLARHRLGGGPSPLRLRGPTEYERIEGPVLTGYCLSPLGPDCDEFGDQGLAEIAGVCLGGLPPERDLHFEPMRVSDVKAHGARQGFRP